MIKKGDIIEVNISDYAYGGKGIGSLKFNDNQVIVFVNHAIPGQKVHAVVKKKKSNYLEADITEIICPSSVEQITPYQRISGAPYIHIPLEEQKKKNEISSFN